MVNTASPPLAMLVNNDLTATGTKFREADDQEAKVRLYDRVDGTWTLPLSEEKAHEMYLKVVVYKCSACNWTSIWDNELDAHVATEKAIVGSHERATVEPVSTGAGPGFRCTACGTTKVTDGRARLHIRSRITQEGISHENVQLLLVRRFALEESAIDIETASISGPVASQVLRSEEPRPRRRRHRRSRSRHGNSRSG